MPIYADDVVLFSSTKQEELAFIKAMLHKFGDASGLRVNLLKSSITLIRCTERVYSKQGNGWTARLPNFRANIWGYPCPFESSRRRICNRFLTKWLTLYRAGRRR